MSNFSVEVGRWNFIHQDKEHKLVLTMYNSDCGDMGFQENMYLSWNGVRTDITLLKKRQQFLWSLVWCIGILDYGQVLNLLKNLTWEKA